MGTVRLASSQESARRTFFVAPHYSKVARSFGRQGWVRLRAEIDKDGIISNLIIFKPAGVGLDEAAVGAAQQWKYAPTLLMGEPVPVVTFIDITFRLK